MNNKSSAQGRPSTQLREDLASLIEQAIKAPAVTTSAAEVVHEARPVPAGLAETLPHRLIEELSAVQEQLRADPPLTLELSAAVSVPPAVDPASAAAEPAQASRPASPAAGEPSARSVAPAPGVAGMLRNWRSRYLALLCFVHGHVFDRRIERLLFFKSPAPRAWLGTEADGQKKFCYRGPIPEMVLGWALSALPAELKRFAFVDFEAGNGRTLLLAARRNFEHAIGYTGDSDTCAMLEMNLAQYSRSYMSCRDVRALRGDRDGIPIPPQPAVLFFPVTLSPGQLGAVFSQLEASMKLSPRPIYLIFENSGPERDLEQMALFRKVPLPMVNWVKAKLFSPANIAVYKSRNCGSAS